MKKTPVNIGDYEPSMRSAAKRARVSFDVIRSAKVSGCSAFRRNGSINMPELRAWLNEHSDQVRSEVTEIKDLKRKRMALDVERKTIELRQLQDQLITKDIGRRVVTRFVMSIKFQLLSMPKRLAQRLAFETDPLAIEQILDGEMRRVITENKFEWGLLPCPKCGEHVDL